MKKRLVLTMVGLAALILLGGAVSVQAIPVAGAGDELTFKVMFLLYQNGELWYPISAKMEVKVGDQVYGAVGADEAGRMTFKIPNASTSKWTLTYGRWSRKFRAEFVGGYLYLYDEDGNNRNLPVGLAEDGSYFFDYFVNGMYISNPGDAAAPAMGRVAEDSRLAKTTQADPNPLDVARFWEFSLPEYPGYTLWSDLTIGRNGQIAGVSTLFTPENEQWIYHWGGRYSNGTIEGIHINNDGTIDISFTGKLDSATSGSGEATLPKLGTTKVTGTGWHWDPRGESGGAEDFFGGGGVISLDPGSVVNSQTFNAAKAGGQALNFKRVFPFSQLYAKLASLKMRWVYPNGSTKEWSIPLGSTGTLSDGITYDTRWNTNGLVNYIDLRTVLPAAFVSAIPAGNNVIYFWLEGDAGHKSNKRWLPLSMN